MYWTHQNVKQWLSSNFFEKYQPALRESGVHGALIVSIVGVFNVFCQFVVVVGTLIIDFKGIVSTYCEYCEQPGFISHCPDKYCSLVPCRRSV